MEEDIDNVDVILSLKSDHSAIVPFLNGMENGPGVLLIGSLILAYWMIRNICP